MLHPITCHSSAHDVELHEFYDAEAFQFKVHYDVAVAQDWDNGYGIDVDEPFTMRQLEQIAWLVSKFHAAGIIAGQNFTKRNIRVALGL